MDLRQRFPGVHYIWGGSISHVYEVHPRIVAKVTQPNEYGKERFAKELKIFELFEKHSVCPSIIQCFHYSDAGLFLEYMRDTNLIYRIQQNHDRDPNTRVVTKVHKLEPLRLRKRWMNDLAQAVAFLESLNLAHGDLRPENMVLDKDTLKLCDFDNTAEFGTEFETSQEPYGRLLSEQEVKEQCGTSNAGYLGVRTEQFSLGSVFYLINYGFEVYGDHYLAENWREHAVEVSTLLQKMQFPTLDGDPALDEIIRKCWHNEYRTLADLAAETERLLSIFNGKSTTKENGAKNGGPCQERATEESAAKEGTPPKRTSGEGAVSEDTTEEGATETVTTKERATQSQIDEEGTSLAQLTEEGTTEHAVNHGESTVNLPDVKSLRLQDPADDFASKKAFCKDLEAQGLLDFLNSADPEELGYPLEWYRHHR